MPGDFCLLLTIGGAGAGGTGASFEEFFVRRGFEAGFLFVGDVDPKGSFQAPFERDFFDTGLASSPMRSSRLAPLPSFFDLFTTESLRVWSDLDLATFFFFLEKDVGFSSPVLESEVSSEVSDSCRFLQLFADFDLPGVVLLSMLKPMMSPI